MSFLIQSYAKPIKDKTYFLDIHISDYTLFTSQKI